MSLSVDTSMVLAGGASSPSGSASISQELLETATYVRAGADLVLHAPDGSSVTVEGYFNSSPPPALVADNGALLTGDTVELLAGPGPVQLAQAGGTLDAGAADGIGKVQTLDGTASVQRVDGTTVELKVGTPVFQGDVVEVSQQGKLGITFDDGSVFSLSNGGTMVLNEMVYNPGSSSNKMLFSLVKGSLGFVTGEVAGSGGVEVNTPVAVMAIRGTKPLIVQLGNGLYAILSAEGDFTVTPNLPGGEATVVTSNGGVQLFSSDGTVTEVSLEGSGVEGLVGAILQSPAADQPAGHPERDQQYRLTRLRDQQLVCQRGGPGHAAHPGQAAGGRRHSARPAARARRDRQLSADLPAGRAGYRPPRLRLSRWTGR